MIFLLLFFISFLISAMDLLCSCALFRERFGVVRAVAGRGYPNDLRDSWGAGGCSWRSVGLWFLRGGARVCARGAPRRWGILSRNLAARWFRCGGPVPLVLRITFGDYFLWCLVVCGSGLGAVVLGV